MTLLIWLAVSSLLWGGLLWLAGRALQRSADVSGAVRQWVWRGASALLIAPWLAAPLVLVLGLGLAPAETTAVATAGPAWTAEMAEAMHGMDVAGGDAVVADGAGGFLGWPVAPNLVELLVVVVIAGWLVRFVSAQLALRSLLGIVNQSRPAQDGPALSAVVAWARRLKLRQAPRLLVTTDQHSPFSFGVMRPTICLPDGLETRLSRGSLDLVIGHESLHVARGDGWLRPLERVTADLLWFNPFAWLIRRELDVARELACDEAVIAASTARVAYARTLRDVAGFAAGLPATAPAASMSLAGGRSLMLRVSRTLAHSGRKPARAAILVASLIGLAGAPLAVAQVMLVAPAPPAPPAPIAPVAPVAPEPPKVETQVYVSQDGIVRASFAAQVTEVGANAAGGYRVSLEGVGRNRDGNACVADLDGLGAISVQRGQMVSRGQEIGQRGNTGSLSFQVSCSDEVDGNGRPVTAVAPPPPPAPPAPAATPRAVAPAAPPAPAWTNGAQPPAAPPALPTPSTNQVAPVAPVPPVAPAAPVAPAEPASPIALEGGVHPVLVAPARISAAYGVRVDPFTQTQAFHQGVDLAAAQGVEIHAPAGGVVVFSGVKGSGGRTVEMDAADGVRFVFSHLDAIKVNQGDKLASGHVIGTVGSSGLSTGPHVHVEALQNGQAQDPEKVGGLVLIGP